MCALDNAHLGWGRRDVICRRQGRCSRTQTGTCYSSPASGLEPSKVSHLIRFGKEVWRLRHYAHIDWNAASRFNRVKKQWCCYFRLLDDIEILSYMGKVMVYKLKWTKGMTLGRHTYVLLPCDIMKLRVRARRTFAGTGVIAASISMPQHQFLNINSSTPRVSHGSPNMPRCVNGGSYPMSDIYMTN